MLTEHFQRYEFRCRCGCGFNTVDWELLECLQKIRTLIGQPIIINSGARCFAHNVAVEGRAKSYHLKGQAADIRARIGSEKLYDIIDDIWPLKYGLKRYRNFVHFDVRSGIYRKINWA